MLYVLCLLKLASLNGLAIAADRILFLDAEKENPTVCMIDSITWSAKHPPACHSSEEFHIESGHPVELVIWNRRLLSNYYVEVDKVFDFTSPDLGIRGFEFPMLDKTIEFPAEKQARVGSGKERIKKSGFGSESEMQEPNQLSVEGILNQLIDEKKLYEPRLKLEQQLLELKDGQRSLVAAFDGLEKRMQEVDGNSESRPGAIASPTVQLFRACVDDLTKKVAKNFPQGKDYMNSDEIVFLNTVQKVNQYLGDLSELSKRLYKIRQNYTRTNTEVQTFTRKVSRFLQHLRVVEFAIESYAVLRRGTPPHDFQTALNQMKKKQLLKKTLDKIDSTEVENLIDKYKVYSGFAWARADVEVGITSDSKNSLSNRISTWKQFATTAQTKTLKKSQEIQCRYDYLRSKLLQIRQSLNQLLRKLDEVYEVARIKESQPKRLVRLDHTGNLRVYYTIYVQEGFSRTYSDAKTPSNYRYDKATTLFPQADRIAIYSGKFEVHKCSQASIVAGFVFSSLEDSAFVLGSRQNPHNPAAGTENFIASKYSNRQLHYLLGLQYNLKRKDTFPGAHRGRARLIPGILGGVSLNKINHYFLGLSFEPELGITISGGLHYGSRFVPATSFEQGETLTGFTEVPMRHKMKIGWFGMIGLDLHIFYRVFGKVSGIGPLEP